MKSKRLRLKDSDQIPGDVFTMETCNGISSIPNHALWFSRRWMPLDVITIAGSVEPDKILFPSFMINLHMKDEHSDEQVLNLKALTDKIIMILCGKYFA